MFFFSSGKPKWGSLHQKTTSKSFWMHFDQKWCMAFRLEMKFFFWQSKSRQSISHPLSIIQHLLHLCEFNNIGILPLHQNQQDVIPFWYLSRNFSIKSQSISLPNHYSCFKPHANMLRRQYPPYLDFGVCGPNQRLPVNPSVEMKMEKRLSIYLGRSRSTR